MTSTRNIIVRQPQQLSVQWAQHVVDQHHPDAKVSAVKIHAVNIGTSTRWRIIVNHDAGKALPTRWFVKTPSLALKPRVITTLPRLLHKEVSFYTSLSKNTPVKLPRVLAAQSRLGRGTTLVMTDLEELGFKPGQPSDALDQQQARLVLGNLAQLHAHYWNDHNLLKTHRWLNGLGQSIENHLGTLMAVPLMKRGLSLAGSRVPKKLHASALRYAADRRRITRMLASGTPTLVHHDCHPGNLFWMQSEPGFLDWQLVRMGEGLSDVAYFLATALTPESRRQHEKQLLQHYLTSLSQHGIQHLDEHQSYQRYRHHLVYAFEAMVLTLAIGGMMDQASNEELISRTAAAIEDHDSYAALFI